MTAQAGNEETVVRTVDGTPSPVGQPAAGSPVGQPVAGPVVQQPGATPVVQTTHRAGTSPMVVRPAWGPTQIVVLVVGLVATIFGAVALARTGTDFSNLPATHAQVAGMGFTALSAAVQLAAGVVLLACGMSPYAARAGAAIIGVASLVWGIVIVADTVRLFSSWGYTRSTGVVYIVAGAVLLLSALLSPVFASSRREVQASATGYDDRF